MNAASQTIMVRFGAITLTSLGKSTLHSTRRSLYPTWKMYYSWWIWSDSIRKVPIPSRYIPMKYPTTLAVARETLATTRATFVAARVNVATTRETITIARETFVL